MKMTLQYYVASLTMMATLLATPRSFGFDQVAAGVFGANTNTPVANTNIVEVSATVAPSDVTTFSNAVAAAWTTNYGGVYNLSGLSGTANTLYRATYGPSNGKRLTITSSANMQSVGWPPSGSFNPISYSLGTCQSADSTGYSLTIGPITDALSGTPLLSEQVSQVGLVILSRTSAQYPADVRITTSYSDGTTEAVTSEIGNVRGADDTFFGFTAPAGQTITNLQLESFDPGTETPKSTRIAWDDLGFITTPTGVLPPPQIAEVFPPNYAVSRASNGIHFEARSAVPIDQSGISLLLNGNNVSAQLVVAGDSTNRFVSFNNLQANLRYVMEITVNNAAGSVSVTQSFYTAESPLTLFDSGGFADDVLYPVGLLQAVTNNDSRWVPSIEPSEIVDLADGQYGKVMRRMQLGNDQIDYLLFPPVSSGTVIIELDARMSAIDGRTLDLSLNSVTANGGGTQGPFIMWGTNALNQYNGTAWVAQTNMDTGWHHLKLTCYVSGPLAGKFDLDVDGDPVGKQLVWRNTFSPVGTLRIGAIRGAVIQYGEVDNLVLRVAPEPLVALPVTLLNPSHSGSTFSFAFQTLAGVNYLAQHNHDLGASTWTTLETVPGDGSIRTVTHTNPPVGPLYYRVGSQLP